MNMDLPLPMDISQQLLQCSASAGIEPSEYAIKVLSEHFSTIRKPKSFSALLEEWMADESDDQAETSAILIKTLDEDRSSSRQLFPPELKGKTW